jgi:hypothetical protein
MSIVERRFQDRTVIDGSRIRDQAGDRRTVPGRDPSRRVLGAARRGHQPGIRSTRDQDVPAVPAAPAAGPVYSLDQSTSGRT